MMYVYVCGFMCLVMCLWITVSLTPLRQDLSPNLELHWWPACPSDPVSTFRSPGVAGTYLAVLALYLGPEQSKLMHSQQTLTH